MSTKLYVGNLADSTTETSIRELFDAFGVVSEVAVLQGFGFVHFRKSEDAQAARQALNDTEFEGTRISVQISHTKGHGYGRGGGRGGRSSGGDRDDYRGRGRYGEQQLNRNYDRGHYSYDRYDDRHSDRYHSDRYHGERDHYSYPDVSRYRSDYRDREYEYSYGGRSRSPLASRDYYRDSQYERDSYRDPEPPYVRDGYRDYTRERHHYRPRY